MDSSIGVGFRVEEGGTPETEVVAEPSWVRAVRGDGGGTAAMPVDGLLPTVAAAPTGRG
jgi:hypothetical protein